jgi:exodeoxyribonuclease-5
MDTDGCSKDRGRISFSSVSKQLALDVQKLVQSLGGIAPISTLDRTHEGKSIEYHVNVRTLFNPFWTQRKAEKWSLPKHNTIVRAITGIRKLGKEQQLCIKVSASDELYLTDQYVVTHNTSLAKYIAAKVFAGEEGVRPGSVVFAAYTGKAAARLKQKGCQPSSTVHRLIYKPIINEDTGKLEGFKKNIESPLIGSALCVVDEVSMVGPEMGRDLEGYKIPILVLGDPGQLPPIKDEGYFTQAEPDYMLTEITRQALESPIILIGMKARNGETIEYGNYDNQVIVLPSQREISDKWLEWGTGEGQFICGANTTRAHFNQRARQLMGYAEKDPFKPVKGEKLIALKNDHMIGIMNGTQWICSTPKPQAIKVITNWREVKAYGAMPKYANSQYPGLGFNIKSLDFFEADGSPVILKDIQVSAHLFNKGMEEPPWKVTAGCQQFDFGHCVTAHKAQGSEWDKVVVINEAYLFREYARNWAYTAITRAAKKLVLRL